MEAKVNNEPAGSPPPVKLPLIIKIKFPKKAEEEEETVVVKSHYCKDCDKSFSSGKALGGHMSKFHAQANKDSSSKKLNSKRKSPTSSASGSGSPNATCSQCGKVFHSDKSLFGHMRLHPERPWRGMVPPPQLPTAAEEEDVCGEDDRIDCLGQKLGFHVRGWPTSKRGRAAMTIRPDSGSGSDKGAFVAGLQLIKMLNANENPRPEIDQKNPAIHGAADGIDRSKGEEKLLLQNQNQNSETLIVPLMAEAAGEGKIDPKDELLAIKFLASGMEAAAAGVAETTSPSSRPECFKCNQCPESFSTNQAFGGHRSSHSKCKINVYNTKDCYFKAAIRPMKKKKKGKVVRVSNRCSTSISVSDKENESSGSDEIKSGSAERERAPAVTFTFDLNMEPPQEDEEMMMDQEAAGDKEQD